ncbi:MAG: hypothetical protein WBA13_13675 [Microcoleaceae cyanobacterium]
MLFQLRRTVVFSGVVIIASIVAIASTVFSGSHTNRLIAQAFPSTQDHPLSQLWQPDQPSSTVSVNTVNLNQISSSLSSAWTQDHQSSCNCPVCQGITV